MDQKFQFLPEEQAVISRVVGSWTFHLKGSFFLTLNTFKKSYNSDYQYQAVEKKIQWQKSTNNSESF